MTKRDLIAELNPDAIVWDDFDDAIIGYDMREWRVIYDEAKMADILIADGMTYEDAIDYLGFNVFSTYVGDYTPINIHIFNEFDIDELVDWGFKHIDLGINVDKIQEDLSDKIDLQYKIEVEVMSEKEQEKLYNKLTKDGYVCRILTL